MAFPFHLVSKLIGPVTKAIGIDTSGTQVDAPLTKSWRPLTMVIFLGLIIISVFTDYELSDTLLTVIGSVMVVYVGGRSFEKKAVEKTIDALKKFEEEKRKNDGSKL
jgi:hypothetical protein